MSDGVRRANEERFSRTARVYASSGIAERRAQNEALRRLAAPVPDDVVLDVACGPGAVLTAFAPLVRQAIGLDLTMAMLREARARSRGRGVSLVRGEAERLPFRDGAFTLVCSTWAVHHFGDPRRVVLEMARVCRPGGRLAVGDLVGSEDAARRARQNAIERLRDPAHVELLSLDGLVDLLAGAGLVPAGRATGVLHREFEEWCRIAQSPPDVVARVRQMLLDTQPGDLAGMAPEAEGERIRFLHRWAIVVGVRR